ncbi:MAG TPA: hypothetical protein VMF61_03740 [Candidatus Acidoferrales bacterium]|nr:hypothetical protein [Candidatus Acidoferrales bacterium]
MCKRLLGLTFGLAASLVAMTGLASAETQATPNQQAVAQASPEPTPTPDPLTFHGYYRAYYFTRQNASNNPGVQFNFSPGAKYNSNAVNQASFNMGVQLHLDYHFINSGFYVGGGYFYANPMNGPCSVAANNANGMPCVHQTPPNTNPDNTLPGFALSTFDEAYGGYTMGALNVKAGDQIINTPWANPDLSRIKADAFQGADATYFLPNGLNFDAMDMWQFQARGASTFQNTTLLTSYPAGGGGLEKNIYVPDCTNTNCIGIITPGFFMGKVGYVTPPSNTGNPWQVDGYLYSVADIVNMYWGDSRYTFSSVRDRPWVELQGGWESNTGNSVVGKIQSSLFGLRAGVNVTKNITVTAAFDTLPWHTDQVYLPHGATCNNSNYQISTFRVSFKYFLPLQAGQCFTNPSTGLTSVYYGGWASPYTDNWATDPIFTTSMIQGMADRRAPGTSEKVVATFTSNNHRFVFFGTYAWYDYSNALVLENTTEYDLDGAYRFSQWKGTGPYRGLMLRQRIGVRSQTNTYFPDAASYLGGFPLFKYSRSQLEYDF